MSLNNFLFLNSIIGVQLLECQYIQNIKTDFRYSYTMSLNNFLFLNSIIGVQLLYDIVFISAVQ